MEQRSTLDVYRTWASKSTDHRYLRPKRWNEIEKVIERFYVRNVLEFGAGISTLLFDNLGIKVWSYETDPEYLEFVKSFPTSNVDYFLWDNKTIPFTLGLFDMALVDGCLPRLPQLKVALDHAKIIAVDDFAGSLKNSLGPYLSKSRRLDSRDTIMAIFKII